MTNATAILAAIFLSACSWTFVTGPGTEKDPEPGPCTTSLAIPIVDGVLASATVIGGVIYFRNYSHDDHEYWSNRDIAEAALVLTLAITASGLARAAVHGVKTAHSCREDGPRLRALARQRKRERQQLRRFDAIDGGRR